MVEVFWIDDGRLRAAGGVRLSAPFDSAQGKPVRLLITARDVAAALHLVQVARAAAADARFAVTIATQEPAARHFAAAGLPFQTVRALSAKPSDDQSASELRAIARELLQRERPDAVLVGLSTPFDAGLDEAVLAETRVPSSLMQDFWGEQNLILGKGADQILGIDSQASERNAARYPTPTIVVGSPRHAAYAALDIPATRAAGRRALGITDERVIGFFGQALHALAGYRRTAEHFIASVKRLAGVRITLRPHPRETTEQRQQTESLFASSGLPFTLDQSPTVESALATCDVVVSLFSICTFDASYLNRFSPAPVAVPMSLLFDAEIAAYCRQHGNYMDFSHHTLGLVRPVYEAAELPAALRDAATEAARVDAWERARRSLPNPSAAPLKVLEAIAAQVGRRASSSRQ